MTNRAGGIRFTTDSEGTVHTVETEAKKGE